MDGKTRFALRGEGAAAGRKPVGIGSFDLRGHSIPLPYHITSSFFLRLPCTFGFLPLNGPKSLDTAWAKIRYTESFR